MKNMNSKKKNGKKYAVKTAAGAMAAGILVSGMLMTPGTTAKAASEAEYTKNENVYVRMAPDGTVNGTYLVNSFTVTKDGDITDFGEYDKIQNLTNLETIEQDKDEQTFTADKGKFYYQGDIEKAELPWTFDITYTLDGTEVDETELAGAEGDLEILMQIRKNPAVADETFWNGYLLQVTTTLDSAFCEDIQAKGASISDAGANEQITWVVNPGTEADLKITASVKDFEMDDISIAGAAATDLSVSFVSDQNEHMGKTTFIMSAEGVTIPDEEPAPVEQDQQTGFLDKLRSLFS